MTKDNENHSAREIMGLLSSGITQDLTGHWYAVLNTKSVVPGNPTKESNDTVKILLDLSVRGTGVLRAELVLQGGSLPQPPLPFTFNELSSNHDPEFNKYAYILTLPADEHETFFKAVREARAETKLAIKNNGATIQTIFDYTLAIRDMEKLAPILSSGRLHVADFHDFRSDVIYHRADKEYGSASARFVTLDDHPLYCQTEWYHKGAQAKNHEFDEAAADLWARIDKARFNDDFDALIEVMVQN